MYSFNELSELTLGLVKVSEAFQPLRSGFGFKALLVPVQTISEKTRQLHLLSVHSGMQRSACEGQDEDQQ
jgi:hypothetical protein